MIKNSHVRILLTVDERSNPEISKSRDLKTQ